MEDAVRCKIMAIVMLPDFF